MLKTELEDKDFLYDLGGDLYVVWGIDLISLTGSDSLVYNLPENLQESFEGEYEDIVRVERNGEIIWQMKQEEEIDIRTAVRMLLDDGPFECKVEVANPHAESHCTEEITEWKEAKCIGFLGGALVGEIKESMGRCTTVRTDKVKITRKY